jgi:hypothetical protein
MNQKRWDKTHLFLFVYPVFLNVRSAVIKRPIALSLGL